MPADPALLRALAGSHVATFEARVVTGQPTGDDPAGTEIPILSGDVQYDSTAEVFATLSLTTAGKDETSGAPLFPRSATDLLAPYGSEVFVRRGVDLGSEVLWVPLGYFRINTAEQDDPPDGPIQLSGEDRMAGIRDARLVDPRGYTSLATVGAVVADLIGEVYPAAVIVWDDNSHTEALGRELIVEEDRLAAMRSLVESRGKVIYVDGDGTWRIETAPEPDDIVWDVRAGHAGVLVSAGRRVGREGVFNGVVARGESGTDVPVKAVVVDTGAHSPTRWGGPFGRVPRFFESPLLTTDAQAESAARAMLRRSIGMPYAVDFGAIVNPTLRPREAIRITYRGNHREKHIVETLTIPLTAEQAMSGTTREQTTITIGSAA